MFYVTYVTYNFYCYNVQFSHWLHAIHELFKTLIELNWIELIIKDSW